MSHSSLGSYPPLVVHPYSDSDPGTTETARIVRHMKSGQVNMKATFAGMSKGQAVLIYVDLKRDLSRIKASAADAEVRIKIELRPLIKAVPNTVAILVTSLGPSRKGRKTYSADVWKAKPGPAASVKAAIDIFS